MAQNYPAEMHIIREQQRNQLVCRLAGKRALVISIVISIITLYGFLLIRYSDNFMVRPTNVTKYCNDTKYNFNPKPTATYFAAKMAIGIMFAVCLQLALITCKRNKCTGRQLLKTTIRTIWITIMHLVFMLTLIDILKCIAAIPSPYFFSHDKIKNFYCISKKNVEDMPLSLITLDNSLRKSFPSRRSAIYGFCTTITYIFVQHFDDKLGFGLQAIQQLIALVMGPWLLCLQCLSWERGENHLSDILVGVGIGFIYAMMMVGNMFGSLLNFRVRALPCFKELPFEDYPPAPPINFEDPDCTTIRHKFSETVFVDDNTNEDVEYRELNNTDNIERAEIHNEEISEGIAETQL